MSDEPDASENGESGSSGGGGGYGSGNSKSSDVAYDVAFAEVVAEVISAKVMLMDNRPLEALRILQEAEERHKPNLPEHYSGDEDGR